MFALADGWRVVHRLGGVERVVYVCERCARAIQTAEDGQGAEDGDLTESDETVPRDDERDEE